MGHPNVAPLTSSTIEILCSKGVETSFRAWLEPTGADEDQSCLNELERGSFKVVWTQTVSPSADGEPWQATSEGQGRIRTTPEQTERYCAMMALRNGEAVRSRTLRALSLAFKLDFTRRRSV